MPSTPKKATAGTCNTVMIAGSERPHDELVLIERGEAVADGDHQRHDQQGPTHDMCQ